MNRIRARKTPSAMEGSFITGGQFTSSIPKSVQNIKPALALPEEQKVNDYADNL